MITVNRGYMYDPDDNEVLITEIYYETATNTKLGSKMRSLSYTVIPNEIKEKIEAAASLSYMENIEVSQQFAVVYQDEINMYGKPEKLYFEYTNI
ncbi:MULTISPECIES: hypothetical protein [Bacillus]|uniref:Uncharacterized protein n=3 Tax=Bacillus cereus group TaxID=86661 RepID=A0A243CZ86_BACTU|nr:MULTISPECIES: hypothetical protein [Bacillus cereus group]EEM55747.1 hypothetical protein bthur0007_64490 [Bacillus thuringiensis serovar monterrey BGSC 4AJ1]EEM86575.1 hypothetical protein bthur0012_54150 [Bacillus thuringiensis serovar pulsiensis BGSC 4CC1]MEB9674171.1 hypothetical protein [Bacillus anthracis]OTW51125.1 hypothetical protein BK699_09030 [Bacillus thuringiensis serovar mexicanensis]OTW98970.1 hypothetical protein BK705_22465 [Bacillus thuringiensis serovar monterrey]